MSVSVFGAILSYMKTFNFVLILAGNLIILCQILFCYLLITVKKEVILLCMNKSIFPSEYYHAVYGISQKSIQCRCFLRCGVT